MHHIRSISELSSLGCQLLEVQVQRGRVHTHHCGQFVHSQRLVIALAQQLDGMRHTTRRLLPRQSLARKLGHAPCDASITLRDMSRINLMAEFVVMETYGQLIDLIGYADLATLRLLQGSLREEQTHAEELKDWLKG